MARTAFGISVMHNDKLESQFFGPFQINEHIDSVNHQLHLIEHVCISSTIYVCILKLHKGLLQLKFRILTQSDDGITLLELEMMITARVMNNKIEILVIWKDNLQWCLFE